MTRKRSSGRRRPAVERHRRLHERPGRRVRVGGFPLRESFAVGVARSPEPPPCQVATVEEADEALLRREHVGRRLGQAERGEHRPQCRGPLRVARRVGVQQVGELGGLRVAASVREQRPRLDERHARVALDEREVERVHRLDLICGALHRGRTRKHLAEHDRHLRVVPLEGGENQLQVARRHLRCRTLLEVVGADQEDDRGRVEGEHVLLEANQDAAGGVAADASVGDLHAGERGAEPSAPHLCD